MFFLSPSQVVPWLFFKGLCFHFGLWLYCFLNDDLYRPSLMCNDWLIILIKCRNFKGIGLRLVLTFFTPSPQVTYCIGEVELAETWCSSLLYISAVLTGFKHWHSINVFLLYNFFYISRCLQNKWLWICSFKSSCVLNSWPFAFMFVSWSFRDGHFWPFHILILDRDGNLKTAMKILNDMHMWLNVSSWCCNVKKNSWLYLSLPRIRNITTC